LVRLVFIKYKLFTKLKTQLENNLRDDFLNLISLGFNTNCYS